MLSCIEIEYLNIIVLYSLLLDIWFATRESTGHSQCYDGNPSSFRAILIINVWRICCNDKIGNMKSIYIAYQESQYFKI